jgi:methionyl-tRNA formyltransferase
MKIVFFGTSGFAVPSLERLSQFHGIETEITKPDKPRGRRLISAPSPVKKAAAGLGIPVMSIEGLPLAESEKLLKDYCADLFVVIAYGRILPLKLLCLPKVYSIGLHASLLPAYRGASPINWALINGEKESGVSVFRLNEKMDAGEVVMQKRTDISQDDNAETLSGRLAAIGSDLLVEAVDAIAAGTAVLSLQDESRATVTPKLKKDDGRIDWERSSGEIHNRIRGMYGWPGAFSNLGNKTIKIWSSIPDDTSDKGRAVPGEITAAGSGVIKVACGRGTLDILEIQAEGGKRMKASEYALGHAIRPGSKFVK